VVVLPVVAWFDALTFRRADDVGLAPHEMLIWLGGYDYVVVVGWWMLQEGVDPVVEWK